MRQQRGSLPLAAINALIEREGLDADYVLRGQGSARPGPDRPQPARDAAVACTDAERLLLLLYRSWPDAKRAAMLHLLSTGALADAADHTGGAAPGPAAAQTLTIDMDVLRWSAPTLEESRSGSSSGSWGMPLDLSNIVLALPGDENGGRQSIDITATEPGTNVIGVVQAGATVVMTNVATANRAGRRGGKP